MKLFRKCLIFIALKIGELSLLAIPYFVGVWDAKNLRLFAYSGDFSNTGVLEIIDTWFCGAMYFVCLIGIGVAMFLLVLLFKLNWKWAEKIKKGIKK